MSFSKLPPIDSNRRNMRVTNNMQQHTFDEQGTTYLNEE